MRNIFDVLLQIHWKKMIGKASKYSKYITKKNNGNTPDMMLASQRTKV